MGNAVEHTNTAFYVTKINSLVTDGREDLIAAIIADYERGADPVHPDNEAGETTS